VGEGLPSIDSLMDCILGVFITATTYNEHKCTCSFVEHVGSVFDIGHKVIIVEDLLLIVPMGRQSYFRELSIFFSLKVSFSTDRGAHVIDVLNLGYYS